MMKKDNLKFWDHEPDSEKKKVGPINWILRVTLFIVGFLIVGFIIIGIFYHPIQSSEGANKEQVASSSCKYSENNFTNIIALINEYRTDHNLPNFIEFESLNKYQEALLAEVQKNGSVLDNGLKNITEWQENNINKSSIVYLGSDIKEFGVSSFSTPCNAFEYFKNNNNAELLSTSYDSLGIALAGNDTMILLGKKTDKPSQIAIVDQNYINSLQQQKDTIRQQIDSEKAALDAQEKTLQENIKKTETENKYKEFLSQITIAVAADNFKSDSKPLSASCSKAGSVRFSYISDKLSSASTAYGSIYVSAISNKVSSVSGRENYYCSYIGDNISSCNGSSGYLSISHIGDHLSSLSNNSANVMSHYSYIGGNISSVDEADLGSCSIN